MKLIKRALISVSDKSNIVEFAKALTDLNIEIISTGGTAKLLQAHQIPMIEISEYTGFPEMFSGRLKTLHPKVHGGILARRGLDDQAMNEHNIPEIDLVVVNLYPFQDTIKRNDVTFELAIENIDIGGPTMLRAAAKNHRDVTVICNPKRYSEITQMLHQQNGMLDAATRFQLSCETFEHTAAYDSAIANYLGALSNETKKIDHKFPRTLNLNFQKHSDMRYGENPHQQAALYAEADFNEPSLCNAKQLNGKALSYNNIADTDAALSCVNEFSKAACVIVKHANPCGVAEADSIYNAYLKAFECDPTSAFGGIIAFNQKLDAKTAQKIIDNQFVEVIIAPEVEAQAITIIHNKKNVRLLSCGYMTHQPSHALDFKKIQGGLLVQDKDQQLVDEPKLSVVTNLTPTDAQMQDLLFAWKVVKHVKSNAIVYAKNSQTIGIGAGQMSRVFSSKIAIEKAQQAKLSLNDAVMASDAFFPFRDGVDQAVEQGITAIIQPGGSIRDQEIIDAANQQNIAMIFTSMRHFKH
ncbi:bifunctional phosphoribosylaminoimidazolecarboxamide formyltransferase/IMP cyclohydrolase [Thiotrichales bacterium 19S3-7]|nr:bifunctional phosphoribosylaminoimidazolecarboxamide formyltransferase/IMP cyclohydrolase [Thiotrichales bacterium 19S3-7]MCF6801498.1 bifunctional phosphoribosylaminoimidazolecarboxamide formyltransferase/IMP cyclohydrolase [Thiotrichales bacterium 19S3-11]